MLQRFEYQPDLTVLSCPLEMLLPLVDFLAILPVELVDRCSSTASSLHSAAYSFGPISWLSLQSLLAQY